MLNEMTYHLFEAFHLLAAPKALLSRLRSKANSLWLRWTYPFVSVGKRFWVHYSCDIRRTAASYIKIGDSVQIDRGAWINVPSNRLRQPIVTIGDGCNIGRRCMISAQNSIQIDRNTIFGPHVLLMDHGEELHNGNLSLADGTGNGGVIRIEEGCWIGFGAAIVCCRGQLVVGKNSVIGANAVVTGSTPPYSVVIGNPGRVVKQFDPSKQRWVIGFSGFTGKN
jgi:acetyltransferase-like isoleucine patch superfamily enzyme